MPSPQQGTPQQQTWATGDFSKVGTGQILTCELLCEAVGMRAGRTVLDIATGSGSTALAAARRGGQVTGVDFVPALLERARERAAVDRLKINFQEGDAEALPFADGSFDFVLSTFGVMFADPARATPEMLRVCRSGGKIGMTNWTPDGMLGEMFRITASFAPPPPGAQPPPMWGDPEVVRQRFGDAVSEVRCVTKQAAFRHYTPESWVDFMKKYFGPTIRAHERAGDRAGELTAAMLDLARRRNQSGDETFYALGDYLEVVAVKA